VQLGKQCLLVGLNQQVSTIYFYANKLHKDNMRKFFLKRLLATLLFISAFTYGSNSVAHSVGNLLDAGANNASATDVYQISCFDDGGGPTAYLFIQIQDGSIPVPGLLVSAQAYFDQTKIMTNTSDPVSGDANASSGAQLSGGNGNYIVSVSKTAVGARQYNITVHCWSVNGGHTGTDVNTLQLQ